MEALDVPAGELLSMRSVPVPLLGSTPTERPLVYVTLGTVFNASLDVFRTVLPGLADEPVDVVVTIGATQDPSALRPVPGNAQVERFIPQATLLPRCAAVVHHAGSGTMMGALGHGLPQVLIPQGADNFINASLLERAGTGRALLPGAVTPEKVRQAVRQVLDEPSYSASARRAAAEIAAMPSAADIAAALDVRVNAGRGVLSDVDRGADGH